MTEKYHVVPGDIFNKKKNVLKKCKNSFENNSYQIM